ncbi:MAG: hypothetical protein V1911_00260, partial [Candidatus Micrarchaeota archaeon]
AYFYTLARMKNKDAEVDKLDPQKKTLDEIEYMGSNATEDYDTGTSESTEASPTATTSESGTANPFGSFADW